ncbi:Gfo/Idh/MocA family protein [Kutzneria buriramensis]|uniref:Putative dehydrogenase n=1 Tax=Kutzneria buriramensis TaxID=1045776 RepID=A0A3E0HFM8_9PSEU|nr:Gfo/Idh/MocA family oxidoreductase [Kutzneria buriramensis]REH44605.1 putative dehydrogenase [Kutzneria buriramensis]
MSDTKTVRIGVLGAARIAPNALIAPARGNAEAEVVAVAARDRARAAEYARKHGIAKVHGGYEELLADPDIDAVYNPLPNGLHAQWTLAALAAGKHVLCEKPFTSNATEAATVAEAADNSGLVVMEAFHYRYHPLAQRVVDIVASGEVGKLKHVQAALCFPLPKFSDIRYNRELAGGAMMDAGCYALHMVRLLGGDEPDVVSAHAKLHKPDVDRAMKADLVFPKGHTGSLTASLWSADLLKITASAIGDKGRLDVFNFVAPQAYHRLTVRTADGKRVERLSKRPSYSYQLDAFCAAVLRGEPVLTPPSDSIKNMTVIDEIYRKAGLSPR